MMAIVSRTKIGVWLLLGCGLVADQRVALALQNPPTEHRVNRFP